MNIYSTNVCPLGDVHLHSAGLFVPAGAMLTLNAAEVGSIARRSVETIRHQLCLPSHLYQNIAGFVLFTRVLISLRVWSSTYDKSNPTTKSKKQAGDASLDKRPFLQYAERRQQHHSHLNNREKNTTCNLSSLAPFYAKLEQVVVPNAADSFPCQSIVPW